MGVNRRFRWWGQIVGSVTISGKRKSFEFGSSRSEFSKLTTLLGTYAKSCEIALEPTGDYHRTLAFALIQAGHNVHFVSSMSTSRAREMYYNTWDKNDPKDAQVILSLLKAGNVQTFTDPLMHGNHDLQELANTYQSLVKRKTRIYHTLLTHYLPLYFPEAQRFITNGRAEWFIDVLRHAPCPASVLSMSKVNYVKRVMTKGGKPATRQKLIEEFYDLAKESTGLPVRAGSISVTMFKMVLDEYSQLNVRRKEIEDIIEQRLHGGPDYQKLRSIPGIGPVLALIILAEAGNMRRFSNYKKFLKYCGLNLNSNQSGKSNSNQKSLGNLHAPTSTPSKPCTLAPKPSLLFPLG